MTALVSRFKHPTELVACLAWFDITKAADTAQAVDVLCCTVAPLVCHVSLSTQRVVTQGL